MVKLCWFPLKKIIQVLCWINYFLNAFQLAFYETMQLQRVSLSNSTSVENYKVSTYSAASAVSRGILLFGVDVVGKSPVFGLETFFVALGWSIFDTLWDMLLVLSSKITSLKYSQDALVIIMLAQIVFHSIMVLILSLFQKHKARDQSMRDEFEDWSDYGPSMELDSDRLRVSPDISENIPSEVLRSLLRNRPQIE